MSDVIPPPEHNSSSSNMNAQKYCAGCDTFNPPDAKHCKECGKPLNGKQVRASATVTSTAIAGIAASTISTILSSQLNALLGYLDLPQIIIPAWVVLISRFSVVSLAFLLVVVTLTWMKPFDWIAKNGPKLTKWVVTFCVLLLFVMLAGTVLVASTQPSVQIDSPVSNSIVQMNTIVSGSAHNVPGGQTLWILLYDPQLRLYYPQDPHVTIQPNGNWTEQVYIGSAKDTGKQFAISVVLADQTSNDFFVNYTTHGERTGDWPGITPEQLQSSGAFLYQQNIVTRAG
jgi:ribosomal protein L40E